MLMTKLIDNELYQGGDPMQASINIYTLKQVRVGCRRYDLEDCHINCPRACFRVLQRLLDLGSDAVEKFGILALNAQNQIVGLHIIGIGGLDAVHVHPREVFKAAMMNNAHAIIAFHNHPSGDPKPSVEDVAMTLKLKKAGEVLGISLLDHVIVGEKGYRSLKESGEI